MTRATRNDIAMNDAFSKAPSPLRSLPLVLLVAAASLFSLLAGCTREMEWSAVERMIASDYPGVPSITTDSLAARLRADSLPRPLLLDVRAADEYAVSHLKGAVRIAPDASGDSLAEQLGLENLPPETSIVAYCSVGYRSAGMAGRLRAAGYANAVNLEGSIFRWANEGHPVYRADRPVQGAHPYGAPWSRLLNDSLHAWRPN